MKKQIKDKVILSLNAETIEKEIANLLDLESILLSKLKDPQDRKELRATFEAATTAMAMIWLDMNDCDETTEGIKNLEKIVLDIQTRKVIKAMKK